MRFHTLLPGFVASVRASLVELFHRAAGQAVRIAAEAERRHADRPGVVEVHMPDGRVEYVEARRDPRGGTLLRGAWRLLRAAVRWVARPLPAGGKARPGRPALLPLPIRSNGPHQRNQR